MSGFQWLGVAIIVLPFVGLLAYGFWRDVEATVFTLLMSLGALAFALSVTAGVALISGDLP